MRFDVSWRKQSYRILGSSFNSVSKLLLCKMWSNRFVFRFVTELEIGFTHGAVLHDAFVSALPGWKHYGFFAEGWFCCHASSLLACWSSCKGRRACWWVFFKNRFWMGFNFFFWVWLGAAPRYAYNFLTGSKDIWLSVCLTIIFCLLKRWLFD